jgi:hypothetical protein
MRARLIVSGQQLIVACVIWLVSAVSCVRKYIFKTPSSITTEPTSV